MEKDNDLLIQKELETTFKGAGISAVGIVWLNLFYFLSSILLAKILGARSFGLYSLAFSIVNLGVILSSLGFNTIPAKFIPVYLKKGENSKLKDFLVFLFKTQTAVSVLVALVLIFLSRAISVNVYNRAELMPFLIALSFLIPFMQLNTLFSTIFMGFKKVQYPIYIANFLEPVLRFLFFFLIFLLGLQITSIFTILYLLCTITLLLFIFTYRIKIQKIFFPERISPVPCEKKEIFSYSIPFFFGALVFYLLRRIDILMIGYFLSPDKVGIYGIAFKLSFLVAVALLALNHIFPTIISELHVKKDYKKLEASYKAFTRIILQCSIFVFFAITFLVKPVLLLLGKDFLSAISPFLILGIAQLINVSVGSAGFLLVMTKHPRVNFYNSVATLILNVLLNLLLIPRYEMVGAALATGASICFINILSMIEVYYLLRIHPYSASYFKPILAGLAFLLVGKILISRFNITQYYILFPVFVVTYLTVLFGLGIDKEERYILSLLKNKVLNRP